MDLENELKAKQATINTLKYSNSCLGAELDEMHKSQKELYAELFLLRELSVWGFIKMRLKGQI